MVCLHGLGDSRGLRHLGLREPLRHASGRTIHPLAGRLDARTHSVLVRAGFGGLHVGVEGVRNTPIGEAAIIGIGSTRKILLTDTLVAGDTPAELEYDVAVELAHVAHHDLLAIALIEGGIIILFSALAVVIADRFRFRRDDDPLSRLTIVGALLALLYIVAVPARNVAFRSYDFSADRYAVALTGDPSDAVRALVRDSDQRMEEVCPELARDALSVRVPGNRHTRRGDQSRSVGVSVNAHLLTNRIAASSPSSIHNVTPSAAAEIISGSMRRSSSLN